MSSMSAPDNVLRYPKVTDEDLPNLSQLAYTVSARECGACRDYHVTWPYLRLVGGSNSGPEFCWTRQIDILVKTMADRQSVRWLLAGSADAGVLALVAQAMSATPDVAHSVTIVDQCNTPLTLCNAYADAKGFQVETVKQDLLGFSRPGAFDIVLFHHAIMFFDEPGRDQLMRNTAEWLVPGGCVVAAVYYETNETRGTEHKHTLGPWHQAVIKSAVASGELDPPEDLEVFLQRLRTRISLRGPAARALLWGLDDYVAVMSRAGLSVLDVVDLPFSEEEIAFFARPMKPRVVIVAGKQEAEAS